MCALQHSECVLKKHFHKIKKMWQIKTYGIEAVYEESQDKESVCCRVKNRATRRREGKSWHLSRCSIKAMKHKGVVFGDTDKQTCPKCG